METVIITLRAAPSPRFGMTGPRCPCILVEYNAGAELAEQGVLRLVVDVLADGARAHPPPKPSLAASPSSAPDVSRCASTLRRAALFVSVAVTMDLHAVAVRARNVRARQLNFVCITSRNIPWERACELDS